MTPALPISKLEVTDDYWLITYKPTERYSVVARTLLSVLELAISIPWPEPVHHGWGSSVVFPRRMLI
jgi:hypothetical protein